MKGVRSIALVLICAATLSGQEAKVEQAWALAAKGQRVQAVQVLRTLIASQPGNTDARLLLGSLLMEAGDKSGSLEQLKTAVSQRPRSVEAQNALGEAYYNFGEVAAAKSAFETPSLSSRITQSRN